MESLDPRHSVTGHKTAATISFEGTRYDRANMTVQHYRMQKDARFIRQSAPPNHSLERTRPARRFRIEEQWPGRSARNRYTPLAAA
jgi:hypothetical protein